MDEQINRVLVFGSQLLAVFLVFAGSVLQQSQLKSARPLGTGTQYAQDPRNTDDRYARLWQDPLEAFQEFAVTGKQVVRKADEDEKSETFKEIIRDWWIRSFRPGEKEWGAEPLLIWNVIDARPAPDAIERRRRTRYATVSALASIGFTPTYDSKLKAIYLPDHWHERAQDFAQSQGEQDQADQLQGAQKSAPDSSKKELLVGYVERFDLVGDVGSRSRQLPRTVYVGWHPQQPLEERRITADPRDPEKEYPIDTGAEIKEAIKSTNWTGANRSVIFHHGSSDQFEKYYNNLRPGNSGESWPYFVRATAPPLELFPDNKKLRLASAHQVPITDDKLVEKLCDELYFRIPRLKRAAKGPKPTAESRQRIVILTESDGTYSRHLVREISNRFRATGTQIEVYSYLRGLDGLQRERELDDQAKNSDSRGAAPLASSYSTGLSERGWGTSQYDYLRRLANKLRMNRAGRPPIVAVGVLGSDVYDKVNVLQAVHGELPKPVYFTTGLDGVFFRKEYLAFTRNLVISSGEGLEVDLGRLTRQSPPQKFDEKPWDIPPMRDSYQTGLVHAIYDLLPERAPSQGPVALNRGSPRVWEVGAGGFVEFHDAHGPEAQIESFFLSLVAWGPVNSIIFGLGLLNAVLILRALSCRIKPGKGDNLVLTGPARRFLVIEAVVAGGVIILLAGFLITAMLPKPGPFLKLCALLTFGCVVVGAVRLERYRRRGRGLFRLVWPRAWTTSGIGLVGLGITALLFTLLAARIGAEGALFHEPLGLMSGVGIWPSILLRLVAFLVGLLLLVYTGKMFVNQGVQIRMRLETIELTSSLSSGERKIPKFLERYDGMAGWISRKRIRSALRMLDPFRRRNRREERGDAAKLASGNAKRTGEKENHAASDPGRWRGLSRYMALCFAPKKRFRRVTLAAVAYFVVTAFLFAIWTPTVPARGGLVFFLEKATLSAGVGLYIVHLCFCVELHLFAFGVIRSFTELLAEGRKAHEHRNDRDGEKVRPATEAAVARKVLVKPAPQSRAANKKVVKKKIVKKKAAGKAAKREAVIRQSDRKRRAADLMEEEPTRLPTIQELRILVETAGRLTHIVGVTLLYPLTILSLIFLSRLRVFDDWNMTPSLILTFLFGAGVLVFVSIFIVLRGGRFRSEVMKMEEVLIKKVRLVEHETQIAAADSEEKRMTLRAGSRLEELQKEVEELKTFREGAFALWYRQPIFTALFIALAILGSLGLAEPVASLLAR